MTLHLYTPSPGRNSLSIIRVKNCNIQSFRAVPAHLLQVSGFRHKQNEQTRQKYAYISKIVFLCMG